MLSRLWQQGGICRGEHFEQWLNEKLSKKIIEIESHDVQDPETLERIQATYQEPTLGDLRALVAKHTPSSESCYKHLYVMTVQQHRDHGSCVVYTSESVRGRPDTVTCFGQTEGTIEDTSASLRLPLAKAVRASMAIPYFL